MAFQPLEVGAGKVVQGAESLRLRLPVVDASRYHNAQVYDYAGLTRRSFPHRAPIRLEVTAHASASAGSLRGTAGFGFWNQPFAPGEKLPRLPRYAWFFFGGPPHDMAFALNVPGGGWKAATADFSRPAFLMLAPGAPLGFLAMRVPTLYRRLWPLAQRAIGAAETLLTPRFDLDTPHHYRLDWLHDGVRAYVDDQLVLESAHTPRGRLGFVAWMDNQYAIITPQGRLGFGLAGIPAAQWLALEGLRVTAL